MWALPCAKFWDQKRKRKNLRRVALLLALATTTLYASRIRWACPHPSENRKPNKTPLTCFARVQVSDGRTKQAASVFGTSRTKCRYSNVIKTAASSASRSHVSATSSHKSPRCQAQQLALTAWRPASNSSSSSTARSRATSAKDNPTTTHFPPTFQACRAPTRPRKTPRTNSRNKVNSVTKESKINSRSS